MAEINDGGPAFPVLELNEESGHIDAQHMGKTLRDSFAETALNAILMQEGGGIQANAPAHKFEGDATWADHWASDAYKIADAMLRAREPNK